MREKDKPFYDDCRGAFDLKQEADLRWSPDRSQITKDEFVHNLQKANLVNTKAGCQFSARDTDLLLNDQCPHKLWGHSPHPPLVEGWVALLLLKSASKKYESIIKILIYRSCYSQTHLM